MTVCIAAVCASSHPEGPIVITAADRMITIGEIEYEPAQTKTVYFASQTVGLLAGDMQLHAAVVPRVMKRVREAMHDNPQNINVVEIADFYAEEFGYYRRAMAEKEILVPRGMNFDRFFSKQSVMAHYQVSDIDARLAAYRIESSAIIAGLDPTGGHIFKIENPGVALCYDTPYFACIGSGEWLASSQFMVKKFDKNWSFSRALWLIFEAKARAEAAGGVGTQTDIVFIGRGGQIIPLKEEHKARLQSMFRDAEVRERAIADDMSTQIDDYIKSIQAPPPADMQQTAQNATARQPKSRKPRKR